MMKHIKKSFFILIVLSGLLLGGCSDGDIDDIGALISDVLDIESGQSETVSAPADKSLLELEYDGEHQTVEIDDGKTTFTDDELSLDKGGWQTFSDLDKYNRVGVADAMLNQSMMPTEERESLYVDPTGWKNKELTIDGKKIWLYNRSHLIGYQFTGENNNLKNLMTGTSSLNNPGMLDYESQVADYIHETDNHVRYQVEPVFKDNELVARGVHMQAKSVEDEALEYNVYIFNVEPGVEINYKDGSSTVTSNNK